jgi:hypothetical protein
MLKQFIQIGKDEYGTPIVQVEHTKAVNFGSYKKPSNVVFFVYDGTK